MPTHLRDVAAWAVREGVTNVVRHSGAHHAWVTLSPAGVEVGDDGPGISSDAPPGNGLIGLAERARLAGAVMTVQSGPDGRGTVLRVVVHDSPASPPERARMGT